MADISKVDLKKEITAILKDADLNTTSAKKIRQEIEEKLDCDLSSRKKEIDEMVMEALNEKKGAAKKGAKKNGKTEDDEEEEEEEDEDKPNDEEDEEEEEEEAEDEEKPKKRGAKKAGDKRKKSSDDSEEGSAEEKESDEEYSPKKKQKGAGKAKGAKGRKKKGSESDSDEDWGKGKKAAAAKKAPGKKGGGGYTKKVCKLTPELAAVVGSDSMPRHEVVKKMWQIIKEKNLYDPKNKQFAICNDELFKVIGTKRFRTFGMMKYLKNHFVD